MLRLAPLAFLEGVKRLLDAVVDDDERSQRDQSTTRPPKIAVRTRPSKMAPTIRAGRMPALETFW